ncbi:NAD-dependent epimerase/dehydratase family protein [Rossellomorea marisflavi]|uniref:NAD-dependent epimerase/dehydratase family protein n=1 Tax=Rossellomorea marisflavi TaxID=189381 RepID=UPI00203AC554|nr:NAD-dependent epimerase/dehydratase family protein [Rossellomorea marisflavi]MCM2604248.1 NAD-dependent epimerase/dehydratase family protein [Rossellomorea marisflavi]
MKKILITGKNSYVGKNVSSWLDNSPAKYCIDMISLRGNDWENKDFSQYDVVFHVAGIAHVSSDPQLKELYYKVNRDLTIQVANKAKAAGVKQFIFMSSIIVYGDSSNDKNVISRETLPKPSNFYGNSKLEAEAGIRALESNQFKIVIIRPPMIYGKGAKGNYRKLSNVARKFPLFPKIENARSVLHIDNLCEFIKIIIDNEETGIFFPQNKEYVKTSELVELIAEFHGKKMYFTKLFNPLLNILSVRYKIFNKIFGNLIYDQDLSVYEYEYRVRGLRESIILTEKGNEVNERKY